MSEVEINGWKLYMHPLFQTQVSELVEKTKKERKKDPNGYQKKRHAKQLAAIGKLVFENIPANPANPEFRQGKTLGQKYKHWFRAKFFQQYRIFFRYHAATKIIVYVWVNDEKTKRAYGSRTDAYLVFKKMLENGDPPDSWKTLFKECENHIFLALSAH